MIAYVLYTLFIISCFILILVVLLQPGKGDAATALGGGTSGAAFGPRGTTTLLAKITISAAIAFMGIAFVLSVPGLVTGRSVTAGIDTPADTEDSQQAPDDGTAPAGAPVTPADPGTPIPAGSITTQPAVPAPAPDGAKPAVNAETQPNGKPAAKPAATPKPKAGAKPK